MTATNVGLPTPELIIGTAVLWQGEIHSLPMPSRHFDVIKEMAAKGYPPGSSLVQGFVTTTGRFVDRAEALRLAQNSGQLKQPPSNPPELYSEDLY